MRKLIMTIATAGVLSISALSGANAAPVPGFEGLYNAVLASCAPSGGAADADACAAAINALSAAMIAGGVAPATALQSFTELRAEVRAAGGGDAIEALFEELLPESGALPTPAAPPAAPGPTPAAVTGGDSVAPAPAPAPAPTPASPS